MPSVRGFLRDLDFSSSEKIPDISALTYEVYINEAPLTARLPRVEGKAIEFDITSYKLRPLVYTLGAAVADTTTTSITLADVSPLREGDVLQLASGERVEVNGVTVTNASTGAGTISVRRGAAGTTAATQSNGTTARLIGNSQLGNEIDMTASRSQRSVLKQYHQRSRSRVQMGGETFAVKNHVVPDGFSNHWELEAETKLTEMIRENEYTMYYGIGEAPGDGARRKMKGLRQLVGKLTGADDISDEAAYTEDSLIRDLLLPCIEQGGSPDVVLMSLGFMTGLKKWGYAKQGGVELGVTRNLGIQIEGIVIPFYNRRITFIPCPLLTRPGDPMAAIALTSEEVQLSVLEPESWYLLGRKGDVREGEWILDNAIRLENPEHHAMVEGITGFAAA